MRPDDSEHGEEEEEEPAARSITDEYESLSAGMFAPDSFPSILLDTGQESTSVEDDVVPPHQERIGDDSSSYSEEQLSLGEPSDHTRWLWAEHILQAMEAVFQRRLNFLHDGASMTVPVDISYQRQDPPTQSDISQGDIEAFGHQVVHWDYDYSVELQAVLTLPAPEDHSSRSDDALDTTLILSPRRHMMGSPARSESSSADSSASRNSVFDHMPTKREGEFDAPPLGLTAEELNDARLVEQCINPYALVERITDAVNDTFETASVSDGDESAPCSAPDVVPSGDTEPSVSSVEHTQTTLTTNVDGSLHQRPRRIVLTFGGTPFMAWTNVNGQPPHYVQPIGNPPYNSVDHRHDAAPSSIADPRQDTTRKDGSTAVPRNKGKMRASDDTDGESKALPKNVVPSRDPSPGRELSRAEREVRTRQERADTRLAELLQEEENARQTSERGFECAAGHLARNSNAVAGPSGSNGRHWRDMGHVGNDKGRPPVSNENVPPLTSVAAGPSGLNARDCGDDSFRTDDDCTQNNENTPSQPSVGSGPSGLADNHFGGADHPQNDGNRPSSLNEISLSQHEGTADAAPLEPGGNDLTESGGSRENNQRHAPSNRNRNAPVLTQTSPRRLRSGRIIASLDEGKPRNTNGSRRQLKPVYRTGRSESSNHEQSEPHSNGLGGTGTVPATNAVVMSSDNGTRASGPEEADPRVNGAATHEVLSSNGNVQTASGPAQPDHAVNVPDSNRSTRRRHRQIDSGLRADPRRSSRLSGDTSRNENSGSSEDKQQTDYLGGEEEDKENDGETASRKRKRRSDEGTDSDSGKPASKRWRRGKDLRGAREPKRLT